MGIIIIKQENIYGSVLFDIDLKRLIAHYYNYPCPNIRASLLYNRSYKWALVFTLFK